MKKKNIKKMAFVLTFALATPTITLTNTTDVFAATTTPKTSTAKPKTATTKEPILNVTKKTINGLNKSYTLKVNNLLAGSTLRWSSSNTLVAKVTKSGVVTSVSKGTANIKVTITLPNKTRKVLYCKVTVNVIPSTAISIKNAPANNTIEMGSTYDYNRTITPSNSTDKTTWKIKDTKIATVNKNGIVTAVSIGNTVLTATTDSGKIDSVPVIVTEKTAEVTSVILNSGTEIQIKFSEAIDATTVIGTDNILKNIKFEKMTDKNAVLASDYGTLTASLSADNKVLTIQSTSIFKGDYEVIIPSSVRTLENKELKYDKVLTIKDTRKPVLTGITLDETGVIATIQFSEPINTTNFVPSNAKRTDGVQLNSISQNVLINKNNYVLSQDKKSLKIDLSSLSSEDQGKQVNVILAGIIDQSGNPADNITFTFKTDVATRAQAKVVTIERTGFNTITVMFDSAIKNSGTLKVSNSVNSLVGIRDASDYKKVTYTLTNDETKLTGNQSVVISDFCGYNTIGNGIQTATVNFTVNTEAPVITSSKIVTSTVNGIELNNLIITYNKNVTVANAAGTLNATLRSDNDDITSPTIVYTKAVVNGNQVTLTLENSYIGAAGSYTITLLEGFVKDDFYTASKKAVITVTKGTSGSSELPAPTIVQSPSNPSEITVTFSRKVDVATAENISNYRIPGATITSAQVTYNTTNGATVKLTVADGTIVASTVYAVTVTGVKGANNSYNAMNPSMQNVALVENVTPYVISSKIAGDLKTITITFSENIKGTANFQVYQNGIAMPLSNSTQTTILNNTITIILQDKLPSVSNVTIISGVNNSITDYNNNKALVGTLTATY